MNGGRRRAVFLDVDGTYADRGVVPPGHAAALRRVRDAGHAVLLCTGRPPSVLSALSQGFDGVIASAGAHVRIGEQVLRDERFPAALGHRAVEVLLGSGVSFTLEAPEALYCTAAMRPRLEASLRSFLQGGEGGGARDLIDALEVPDDLRTCSFAKISVWSSPVPVDELAAAIGTEVGALPNSVAPGDAASGELYLRRIDKADGVRMVAQRLGIDMADTVGAGDGMNDVGMLGAVGTAIGIEGAPEDVLSRADLVVPGPQREGLIEAFDQLGLMD